MTTRTKHNLIELTDSYKVSHWKQYPPGTNHVYSFFESRGGAFDSVIFFGLQYYLKRYLEGRVVQRADIEEARADFGAHFGNDTLFNMQDWERILTVHQGRLPIAIHAVPEGTRVPTSNVLMTVENTDPLLPWVTNYVETLLSMVWYPTTVATQSAVMRTLVEQALITTGDPGLIDFKVHDFGFRGSTSVESAGIGGSAHLLSFQGTDTFEALRVARTYYSEPMAGFSIPAAEHSTITSWGKENEVAAYANMLRQFPDGLVAVVSDSFDIYHAVTKLWGTTLRDQVLGRNGTLVVRPDSGDPPTVVVKILELLGTAFGATTNAKGYRVLNPKVRVIQGDGIDLSMLEKVLDAMQDAGWSADNIAFGSGGGLLQKVNRDTLRFAMKCSAIEVNGTWHDVQKDPITDPGKRSKPGRLALVKGDDGLLTTVRAETAVAEGLDNYLVPVFKDGVILKDYTFAQIRQNTRSSS
jgi:nicotinamide phosphoribosyltransferase